MKKHNVKMPGFVFWGLFIILSGLVSQSLADEIKIKIPIITVTVAEDAEGYAEYSGNDIQYLTQSGEPMVPYQVIKVLLPPEADLSTVSGTVENAQVEELSGEWEIQPKPPEATWDGKKVITIWPKGKTIVDGYDIDIYKKNVLFPENLIGTISTGLMREWRVVDIPIALYKFNPVTKKLYRLVEGTLNVEYTADPTAIYGSGGGTGISNRIGEDSVKRLTINFDEVSPAYEKLFPQAQTVQKNRYVIITRRKIKFGSNELKNFVASKEKRGFTVEVVTEDVWGGKIGDPAAENIRSWLRDNYRSKNIEYVLLVGDPHPDLGGVPMKMLWPRSYDPTTYRESPSDYYYADLTGNWDLDGDGLYGEWDDDFGSGGVDRNWDVIVGRIPWYGNMNDLDQILSKIIAYENETSTEAVWRQNVLLPMKPSDTNTPGYHLGEAIKDDFLAYSGWSYHRVYEEDYGLTPAPESFPCTYDNVTDAWNGSQFGAIFWWTHGSSTHASSIMTLSHAETLDDSYPGFTFQCSCNNSWPEVTNNLSYSLLKNGCIGTIGATRVSWYYVGQKRFNGSTSNSGMTYEYSKRLIENQMDSGHALYEMKQVLNPGLWMNFTVFNIYGDPSTGLFTTSGNSVFSPSFDDTSTWAVYKDKNVKNTKVITFADGDVPGEKYKVVVRTTTGDTINYLFKSKGSGYTGCDKSAYDGQWPGYRKIELGNNAGYAKLLKMKMIRRSGTGSRNAYVSFHGSGDEGWTQTSGPADGCGWSAAYDGDDAIWIETDETQSWQTDFSADGETIIGQREDLEGDDTQGWMADISATASGNVFSPSFKDTSTWVVYKDTDNKDTKIITFADAGARGEKYKVVIKTTTGDTINYLFTSKGSGYTGCDKSAYGGQWPGYRKIELGSNAGYAKLLKMKMIKRSGSGSRSAYVGFHGSGDEGWTQTSGPTDGCGW